MSRAFLNRNSQNHSNSQQSNSSQQKVDYEAQMKKLDMDINNPGWNTTDISPAQMFAEEEEEKQAKANEEEELQMKPKEKEELQKKEDTNNPGTKTSMPGDVQNKKENSFGIDFSDVNIHKDSEQAPNLSALAYTQDNDIHFVPGQYNPGSQEGQKQKRIHPVEAGETLGDLAEKFDTTPEAIKAANPGLQVNSNGNKEWYRKGDKIQLPKQKNIFNLLMKLGNNYSVKTYKVEKGKTLQDIASQFNTTPAKLKQLNPNVPGKFEGDIQWFNAGEIIKVPPKKSPETQI